jgi:undecaprenyl diphosphate synthase
LWDEAGLAERFQTWNVHHVGVIMDGNRRWAKERGLPATAGHVKGVESFKNLVRFVNKAQLPVLTAYCFSTENWKRTEEEVGFLMQLFSSVMWRELKSLHAENIRIQILGRLQELPASVYEILKRAEDVTAQNTGMILQLAINYGGRTELLDAVQQLAKRIAAGELAPEAIDEAQLKSALYSRPDTPEPDLIIRTGGEMRSSNFLLWQAAYAEWWVTHHFWPDFGVPHFQRAVQEFAQRRRCQGV